MNLLNPQLFVHIAITHDAAMADRNPSTGPVQVMVLHSMDMRRRSQNPSCNLPGHTDYSFLG